VVVAGKNSYLLEMMRMTRYAAYVVLVQGSFITRLVPHLLTKDFKLVSIMLMSQIQSCLQIGIYIYGLWWFNERVCSVNSVNRGNFSA